MNKAEQPRVSVQKANASMLYKPGRAIVPFTQRGYI